MNRTDYILTLTKGILEAPEEITEELLNYFSAIFELKEIQKTGFVSLAASLDNGKEVAFADWVQLLQSEKIKKCLVRSVSQTSEQLPAHIAAAFAGTQEYLIEVITDKTARCFILKTFYSSPYAITPDLLAKLTDAQINKEEMLELIVRLVTDSNELNGRKAVDKIVAHSYFNSTEGKEVFNFLISNITEEMQIECAVSQTPFIIPEQLKHLFYQSDFSFDDEDREIAFLYPLKEPSAEQLLELVHAQSFLEAIWKGCETELKEYPITEIPTLKASEFEVYIKKQTTEVLESSGLTNAVCRVIRSLSEQNHIRPTIPETLKGIFGPDKKDYDKALARGRSKDRWYLNSNAQQWEVSCFELLPIATLLDPKADVQKAKLEFSTALSEIEQFAKKIQSPFEEAFRLANYFLTGILPVGKYDQQHLETISKDLLDKGFSEQAVEVLKNNFLYLEEWHKMKFDDKTILGLFAVNNANHFGGMGSWNDQYVEEDPETYQRVSSQTFEAMKNYFVAILSK